MVVPAFSAGDGSLRGKLALRFSFNRLILSALPQSRLPESAPTSILSLIIQWNLLIDGAKPNEGVQRPLEGQTGK